jgi:hypothetical protein
MIGVILGAVLILCACLVVFCFSYSLGWLA